MTVVLSSRKAAQLNNFFDQGQSVHLLPGCFLLQCWQGSTKSLLKCGFSPGFIIFPQLKHQFVPLYQSMSIGIPDDFAGAVYELLVVLEVEEEEPLRPDEVLILNRCMFKLSSI